MQHHAFVQPPLRRPVLHEFQSRLHMPFDSRLKGHKDLESEHAQALLRCRHWSCQVDLHSLPIDHIPCGMQSPRGRHLTHTHATAEPLLCACVQHCRDAGMHQLDGICGSRYHTVPMSVLQDIGTYSAFKLQTSLTARAYLGTSCRRATGFDTPEAHAHEYHHTECHPGHQLPDIYSGSTS